MKEPARTCIFGNGPINLLLLAVLCHGPTLAFGVTLRPGDILVADPDFVHIGHDGVNPDFSQMQPTVWKIDPNDGTREIVTSKNHGGGSPLNSATAVVVDRLNRITVADPYSAALLRVDPATGDRTVFSSNGIGAGESFQSISAIAVDRDDSLIFVDHLTKNVLRVNATTGDRTMISGATRGVGDLWPYTSTLSLDRVGDIWAAVYDDTIHSALLHIDAATGDRTVVSGFGVGVGPDLVGDIHDVLNVDDQTAIVVTQNQLIQIDLSTGDRSLVPLVGPPLQKLYTAALAGDGSFYIGDEASGEVFRLDTATGIYSLLSGNTPEWGPRIWMPQDMFVVAPEPTSAMITAIACAMAAVAQRRQRSCVR